MEPQIIKRIKHNEENNEHQHMITLNIKEEIPKKVEL